MKNLRKNNLVILAVALIVLASCKKVDASKGDSEDHIVNETGFKGIDFGIDGELTFTESNTTSIIVKTTKKVFNALDIEVDNSILKIKKRKGYVIKHGEEIEIIITAPNVNSLACSGSGLINISTTNIEAVPSFSLVVSGSGNMKANNINAVNQKMTVSGSGILSVNNVTAVNCQSTISSSGAINVSGGTTTNSDITISGSGRFQAFPLDANNADVQVSGSGSVELTALDQLDVLISSSGNVTYRGNPLINFSGSGSGSLINGN